MTEGRDRRLFLALWPQPEVRDRIVQIQRRVSNQVGGRAVSPENLHMTLKFLGPVPQCRYADVVGTCRRVAFEGFDLSLDRVGFFPRPRIVWVGAAAMPEALARLVASLEAGFAELGFEREWRRFHAHCTLFRKAPRRAQIDIDAVTWRVDGFVLVESDLAPEGARYLVRERFTGA